MRTAIMLGLMLGCLADGQDHARPAAGLRDAREWEGRRLGILQAMQEVMGTMPGKDRLVPLDVKVEETNELEKYTRKRITFAVEKGDRIAAWLAVPKNRKAKAPAILCLHPTGALGKGIVMGLSDKPNRAYAAELAECGFVTLAPDYPYMGDNKTDLYALGYVSGTMKGIWNHMRAVDLLCAMDEVDASRIGCIGHSLGGHNTLFLAAFDPRIKAAVTSCGFTAFARYDNGNLTGWCSDKYMPRIASVYDKDPKKMPFDFAEVLAAIAPRPLRIVAPLHDDNFDNTGVRECVTGAAAVYELLGAKQNLSAEYPDCKHDFPDDARRKAYEFFAKELAN